MVRRLELKPPPGGNLLVIAPHPDDEIIGAGGMILAALERGNSVHILYLTDGEGTNVHPIPERIRSEREHITNSVLHALGIPKDNIFRFHLPDGYIPRRGGYQFNAVVDWLAALINKIKPDRVLATHSLDHWPYDHVACSELATEAFNRAQHPFLLDFYWVWAWYNIRPWSHKLWSGRDICLIEITPYVDLKKKLLRLYLEPLAPSRQPWSGQLPKALQQSAEYDVEVIESVCPYR